MPERSACLGRTYGYNFQFFSVLVNKLYQFPFFVKFQYFQFFRHLDINFCMAKSLI